ncbi:MAG: hypothetical protein WCC54_29390 [Pseudolabrys sp.]
MATLLKNDGASIAQRLKAADELAEIELLLRAENFFCAKVACDQPLFSTSVRGRTSRHQTAK